MSGRGDAAGGRLHGPGPVVAGVRVQGRQTAEVVASATQAALLAVDASKDDKAYGRYMTQVLVEAEEDAGSAPPSPGSRRPFAW